MTRKQASLDSRQRMVSAGKRSLSKAPPPWCCSAADPAVSELCLGILSHVLVLLNWGTLLATKPAAARLTAETITAGMRVRLRSRRREHVQMLKEGTARGGNACGMLVFQWRAGRGKQTP